MTTGEAYRVESRLRAADGSYRWFLMLGLPLRDAAGTITRWFGTCTDIEELKSAQEEIRKLTDRLALATRIASIGVWELDLRNNILIWDDLMYEIYGVDKTIPATYETWATALHPDDRSRAEEWIQKVAIGAAQNAQDFRIIRPDGSVRYVHADCQVIRGDLQEVIRVIGLNTDVTKRMVMEAQLEANRAQLVSSARMASLGMMAGGVSHEINNPLAIIHASASDLLHEIKTEGTVPVEVVVRTGERILQTANRIGNIVKSMRYLARDGAQDSFRPASVAKIVEEALEVCKESFKQHSVNLILPNIDPALRVPCREVQIAQVVLNLLQNAHDAVMGQKEDRWIRLDVAVESRAVVLSITDSGPGIPLELRPRIMEPFFTTKEVGKGTGLGLSISQTMIEEHGGKLELTDNGGRTCFSFSLPLSRETEAICN